MLILALGGCGFQKQGPPAPEDVTTEPHRKPNSDQSSQREASGVPDLSRLSPRVLNRDDVRAGLVRLMNEPGSDPIKQLTALFDHPDLRDVRGEATGWYVADLDNSGTSEFVLALPITDAGSPEYRRGQGAALFVSYRVNDRFEVDRTEPMSISDETRLLGPKLHGTADLCGLGYPQVVWSRAHGTATGLRPTSVFVTNWRPGSFTRLSGQMVISSTQKGLPKVELDGTDLVLTGGSRKEMFSRPRSDRYRCTGNSFRLVDRWFVEKGETAYDRFWDGLVAERVGRLVDAERHFREALEVGRKPHSGSVAQYNAPPRELSPSQLAVFGEALRSFVQFRLATLLIDGGRKVEAAAVVNDSTGPFSGLTSVLLGVTDRSKACERATAWASAHPDFLEALNLGVADSPWSTDFICSHAPLEDR